MRNSLNTSVGKYMAEADAVAYAVFQDAMSPVPALRLLDLLLRSGFVIVEENLCKSAEVLISWVVSSLNAKVVAGSDAHAP